jgi:hypothetical protein
VILDRPQLDLARLAAETGWDVRPEGACKDGRCVPLRAGVVDFDAGVADAGQVAELLGMALVADEAHRLWALGPQSGRALSSAQMPDLKLPDRAGRPFSLRSLRGTRIVMVAWASW